MSTSYPATKQSVPNPISTDLLENADATLDHDYQHATVNDTIEALQDKVGVDGSAVTTTHDYKLSAVTGSAKALTSGTSTQSVTNLTLVTPTLTLTSDATGDLYYRNSGGALTRLPIGSAGNILDVSAGGIPEWIANPAAADATYAVKGVRVLDANAVYYGADAGSTDAYAITLSPAPSAYAAGQVFTFKANTVNTGVATLNVNSLGAKTIVKGVSTTLANGDIAAGQFVTVIYDGTNFVLQNPTANNTALLGTFTNGTTTKNAADASATQNIAHGLGVTPKKIKITALTATYVGSTTGMNTWVTNTVYNGTTQSSVSMYGYSGLTFSNSFILNSFDNTDTQTGVITFDSTNIIITWTKSGSPTGTYQLLWEAEA